MKPRAEQPVYDELLEVRQTLGWMDVVIGSIDDAVYVTDSDDRLVFANQYFSDLVDTPRIFLLGKKLDEVFPVEEIRDSGGIEHFHKLKGLENNASEQIGIYMWLKQGAQQTFRVSCRQLKTTGQTVHLAQNITHEYELSRMKSNFIDLASHQLRTPMTAIMTYAHMLHEGFSGELTNEQKELSGTIIRASERMVGLVNDLLTITRIQNSDDVAHHEYVLLHDLLMNIQKELQPRIDLKHHTFIVRIKPRAINILSDQLILHEILSNLIVNAIEYTPDKGKISVEVTSTKKYVTITVADNGIGIPKDHISKLFKQFSRADNALAIRPNGTGLGLYVIAVLLDKLKGTVSCKSTLHKGSIFTVKLPIA